MGGTYLALALAVVLAGCGRLNFEERVDATGGDAAPATLTCNVPTKLLAMPDPAMARITAIGAPQGLAMLWISDAQKTANAAIALDAPDLARVAFVGDGSQFPEDYDLAALARDANGTIVGASRSSNQSLVRLFDEATLQPVASSALGSPIAINTPRGVAATGNVTGAIYAVIGKNGTQAAVFGVDSQNNMVGQPLNIGVMDQLMSLLYVGGPIAVLNDSATAKCECRLAAMDLSVVGTAVSYKLGSCDQPAGAYVAGHADILFVTHDLNLGTVESQLVMMNGANVILGTAVTLQTNSTAPRATGNPTSYWAVYRNGGSLEAINISFSGGAGTRVGLGAISDVTGYDVVSAGADSYALWFANGLNVVRLCP